MTQTAALLSFINELHQISAALKFSLDDSRHCQIVIECPPFNKILPPYILNVAEI